ncbi:polysaccharide deacetylase family protein [Nocardiopsis sp. YSL2]|uniref:polysaccharide deacetylase family protein n=1 Tax=Nocardiopsis sp. YSL2 TaxID=2939492 RepID=UPI0026F45C0E|nr:polysaccharide deacetylase family protein [Nocardiopsis sp. YSL2]
MPQRTRPPRSRWLTAVLSVGLVLSAAAPAHARPAATPEIVDSTREGGRAVALTFDDGPHPVHTPRLLDVLRDRRIEAVFCVVGEQVRRHPHIVRRIVAEGHVLCNHTMDHDDMAGWGPDEVRRDLAATNDAIHEAVPGADIPYFRAPYGSWGGTPQVAADLDLQPLGWSLDVVDWDPPGTDVLVERLRTGIEPGSVVLMHDGMGDRSQTVEAVELVVPEFQADGWRFTLPAVPAVRA